MNTPYVDPLIPLHETRDETLTRLSANIGTLTGLMDEAERSGHIYLAGMFGRARGAKVAEAKATIAALTADAKAAPTPVGSPLPPWEIPAWNDAKREPHDAGELLHVSAGVSVIERRFLLVGTAVSDGSATAFSALGQTRHHQHRRADSQRRILPLLTDPRFLQLALA